MSMDKEMSDEDSIKPKGNKAIRPSNKSRKKSVSSAKKTRKPAKTKSKNSRSAETNDQKYSKEKSDAAYKLLSAITEAQSKFISNASSKKIFDGLLNETLKLTESSFGFIGQVLFTEEGKPYLKTHAITNIAWNKVTRKLYDKYYEAGMEFFKMDSLFGAVIVTGQPVVSNDPENDPRSCGMPKGHPPLKSFLGLPFYHGNKMIGVVGMANRPGGYDEELIEYLQPFLLACSNLIQAWASNRERQIAEQVLKARESQTRMITDNLPALIGYVDSEQCYRFNNKSYKEWFDLSPEELYGKHIKAVLGDKGYEKVKKHVKAALSGKRVSFDVLIPYKNYGYRFVHAEYVPDIGEEGQVKGFCVLVEDISERKVAEEKLEFIQQGVDQAADAAFCLRLKDARFSYVNKQACKSLGYTQEELLTMSIFDIDPDFQEDAWSGFQKTLKEEKSLKFESLHQKKNGGTFPVEITAHLFNFQGSDYSIAFARDITKRKSAEKQLKEANYKLESRIHEGTRELMEAYEKLSAEVVERKKSEERYDMAVKGSTDGLWDWTDIERGDSWWSPRFYELLGYENDELEMSFSKFASFLHPEDKERVEEAVWAHLKDRVPYDIECRLRTKLGEFRWFHTRGQAVWDDAGKPQRMSGSVQDITERKLTEEALKESEEKFRQFFTVEPDAILIMDADTHRIIDVNPAAIKLYGYSKEEFLNLTGHGISAEPEKTREAVNAISAGNPTKINLRYHKKRDGTIFPLEISSGSFSLKNRKVVFGVIRDITKRKLDEEELRKLSSAVEQSSCSVIITDLRGDIEYVNPKFTQLSGYTLEEVLGKNPGLLKSGHTSTEEYKRLWQDIISGKEWHGEFHNRTKTGDYYWGLASISAIKNSEGKPTCYLSVMEDITERKKSEEKIKASLKEKEILMREIEHRAKNNLQIVSSLLGWQISRIKEKKYKEMFRDSQNRILSMAAIYDKIMRSDNLSNVNSKEYFESLGRDLLRSYGYDERIIIQVEDDGIALDIDTLMYCGLMVNELVSNSLKYAFQDQEDGEISIKLQNIENEKIKLTVKDSGKGIPADFDFKSAESFGLNLVKTIAEGQLQGEVEILRNRGAEYVITFPKKP